MNYLNSPWIGQTVAVGDEESGNTLTILEDHGDMLLVEGNFGSSPFKGSAPKTAVLARTKAVYTFEREGGFYPVELFGDCEAAANVRCNPGTLRVVNMVTGRVVYDATAIGAAPAPF